MSKYKVLWIDDQWHEMIAFKTKCEKLHDIEVITSKYALEGMRIFEEYISEWDGVILDAKVLLENDNEVAKLDGLRYCKDRMNQLSSKRFVPPYIFTGQPDLVSNELFEQSFGKYYEKGLDSDRLINDIKKGAEELEETQIKFKYSDIINVIPETTSKLIEVIKNVDHGVTNDTEVLVKCRKILESIETFCFDHGICPFKFGDENINEFSRFMCIPEMKEYVPDYIQETIRYCVRVLNPTAHTLRIDTDVEQNKCPYAIRSLVYSVLMLLSWCNTFPAKEEDILFLELNVKQIYDKWKQQSIISNSNLGINDKPVLIEKDERGYLHGGDCMISSKLDGQIGKYAIIIDKVPNTNKNTRDKYPYFGKVKE